MSWPWEPTWFQAMHWFNPNTATPDLWSTVELPDCWINYIYDNDFLNAGEWQWPHTGERYAGMYQISQGSCTRDYVEARLTEPLLVGYTYCVEFYVSLANRSKFCTDCVGISFSTDSLVNFDTYCELDLQFAVWNDTGNSICDTLNWTLISGEYVAAGGEQYIIVGNVRSNEECVLQPTIGSDPTWSNSGYYFIDDVSLMLCDTPENVNTRADEQLIAIPNPCTEVVVVTVPVGAYAYNLYSADGKIVKEDSVFGTRLEFDMSNFSAGIYVLSILSREHTVNAKLVKQ